jgi:hypothetical protein
VLDSLLDRDRTVLGQFPDRLGWAGHEGRRQAHQARIPGQGVSSTPPRGWPCQPRPGLDAAAYRLTVGLPPEPLYRAGDGVSAGIDVEMSASGGCRTEPEPTSIRPLGLPLPAVAAQVRCPWLTSWSHQFPISSR